MSVTIVWFGFVWYGDHRDLHVLTDSYPTRRSSDLLVHAQNLRAVAHGVNTYGQLGATLDAGFDYLDGAAVVASVETPRGTYNFRTARTPGSKPRKIAVLDIVSFDARLQSGRGRDNAPARRRIRVNGASSWPQYCCSRKTRHCVPHWI